MSVKTFALRITKKDMFNFLKKEAKSKPGKWSVNTLINSILEDYQKQKENKNDKV